MSLSALVAAAALAGLAGSPHCVAMCGAACASMGRGGSAQALRFQSGRLLGYTLIGATAAAFAGLLQQVALQAPLLRPFWAMFHVAVVATGASLLWLGTQPAWVDRGAGTVWRALRLRTLDVDARHWPLAAGALWALMPCGLLYSALMLAALADGPAGGAAVMAAFAVASGTGLQFGSQLLSRLRERGGRAGVRIAGAALVVASSWALARGLWHDIEALCR